MDFADGYEGVTVAGLAIVAADTGRVLLAQRTYDETDDPEVQESWEFPGGHLNPGEDPFVAASREFDEELEVPLPPGEVVDGWRGGDDGHYQGFVYLTPTVIDFASWSSTEEVQNVGWYSREEAMALDNLRPEVRESAAWDLTDAVSGNKEQDMTEAAVETEPEFDSTAFVAMPIPVHGVVAPEDVPTGDNRGFNAGSMTRRPMRLPFSDQRVAIGGHDGSVVVGSVDRLMRKDGLIHWEGLLMPSDETEDLIARMEFFGGRYGVSVDGDNGRLDKDKTAKTGQMWFEAVRASGLTSCAIPAFHEAYVAFGYHPEMPEDDSDAVLAASGLASEDIVGGRITFDRGPGWVTNPKETKTIHDYWTKKGEVGYAKIGWGTPGDFRRAEKLIGEKIAKNSPEKMRFLKQIIAQWHYDALGYWPGDLGKPGNAPDTPENRRRAARHAATSKGIEINEDGSGWETVFTASGKKVAVPLSYFDRHPETGATVIDEPDENGFRRTYGYAAEWGVCHIGYSGRCVEPPRTGSDAYPEFHLGRTKTDQGYINTGVLTYLVEHRDAETILSETAEQAHFDNVANAWAAVRVGEDERGIWFSGYVLPGIPDEDCTLIEATGQVSGEWKYGALRGCQSVNVPGYPVLRSSAAFDDEGNVTALVAVTTGRDAAMVASMNGVETSECYENSPKARIEALAKIDAEIRMDALRAQWSNREVV
jgi:8-oxo-dGTP pyrophosphatase MutT (NUDIX family)